MAYQRLKKFTGIAIIIIISILGISFLTRQPKTARKSSQALGATTNGNKTVLPGPLATSPVNYQFDYPLKKKDEEVGNLRFDVTEAEKRQEILVKGQKAMAASGRVFVLVNLKINNPTNYGVEIQTRDFFRLMVNGKDTELMAPDIHNDPVTVQALSTKFTRVGFPINLTDQGLILQIGQLNGSKQQVTLFQ